MTHENSTRARKYTPMPLDQYVKIGRMYEMGATDIEIANEVGCASKTVQRWRARQGKPRNDRLVFEAYWPKIAELYYLEMSDSEIASDLKIDPRFVAKWRQIHNKERN